MSEVHDIKGYILAENAINVNKEYNKILVRGLLLPKDKVSRNGVRYDWKSATEKFPKFVGKSMMYNHKIDDNSKPLGHITAIEVFESRPSDEKWAEIWDKTTEKNDGEEQPGIYYEADINPKGEYADSILRGDIPNVSLQVMADGQREEKNDKGKRFTHAFIGDTLEISAVPVGGFSQTTLEVALAEAFKKDAPNQEISREELEKEVSDIIEEMRPIFNKKFSDLVSKHGLDQDESESMLIDIGNKVFGKNKMEEAIKIGDKVHSPSGYGKVMKVTGNKVIVRSNDPAGDFEYDMKDVQKESLKEGINVTIPNKHIDGTRYEVGIYNDIGGYFVSVSYFGSWGGGDKAGSHLQWSHRINTGVYTKFKNPNDKELIDLYNKVVAVIKSGKYTHKQIKDKASGLISGKTGSGTWGKKESAFYTPDGTKIAEALTPCQKWLKSLDHAPTDDEVHDWVEENGMNVHEVEAQIYKLAKAHVDSMSEACGKKKEVVEPIPEEDADPKELEMGIKVEMEHTDDKEEAKMIALQHLAEVPDYYTKLKKVEEEGMDTSTNAGAMKVKMKGNKESLKEGSWGAMSLVANAFMRDYDVSDNPDSEDLNDWIDQYSRDKRIEDGLGKRDAIQLVNLLKAKGYNKLNISKVKTFGESFKEADTKSIEAAARLLVDAIVKGNKDIAQRQLKTLIRNAEFEVNKMKEFKVVDMIEILTDEEAKELVESFAEANNMSVYRYVKSKMRGYGSYDNTDEMEKDVKKKFGWNNDIEQDAWEAWNDSEKGR